MMFVTRCGRQVAVPQLGVIPLLANIAGFLARQITYWQRYALPVFSEWWFAATLSMQRKAWPAMQRVCSS